MLFQKKVTIGIMVFFAIGTACLATDIHQAAKDGDLDTLKALLEKDPTLANARNESEETPLHMAATGGHLDIVKFLIEKGSDVNASDNQKNTPLHLACYGGFKDVAEELIIHGADIEARVTNGTTPLYWTVPGGHIEMFRFLVDKGADIHAKTDDGSSLLHAAALYGQRDIAKLLMEKGVDAQIKKVDGSTPLNYAASRGHKEVVELLIDGGADVNAGDNRGYTPLRISVLLGRKEVAEILLDRGADPNKKNESGASPLHEAVMEGRKEIAELLISKGADIHLIDDAGHCPLHLAANHGHKDVVELLLAKGADVNNQDKGGDTALHGAAWVGNREIAEILIAKEAPVNIKNSEGRTPLDNALRGSHKEVIELLKAKGAYRMKDSQKSPKKILSRKIDQKGLSKPLKFTILYDNYLHLEGTKPDWGFSCLIEGAEKTILFDTGTRPDILLHNVDRLGVDLKKVEQIVISHDHHDHIGGLPAVLEQNHEVSVYLPVSFAYEIVRSVETTRAEVVSVDEPVEICPNVYSTGEMGVEIKEQSLIINTDRGLVIVTGCSHQGIVEILRRAKELFDRPIHLVFGGFHLGGKEDAELEEIIRHFKEIGVERCGGTHCTGDRAIELFKKAYGESYVPMGTGRILEINKKN
jgi:7,8-dihydropterin-6-yl-methyl-4-(beta-D-ribofuranosyl)aminobenzene 5'-phosphate synthase